MYSVLGHGDMIADDIRTGAYEQALRAAVKPGSVVVDLGTGMGVFAILAVRYGARAVYAIESSEMIEVARAIAAANGCAGCIEFIHAASTGVELPERADVVVCDLRGVLPYFHNHVASIVDARERFLAPGGTFIPARDTVWAACVSAPELHRTVTSPWLDNRFGLDMSAAHALAANQWRRATVRGDQVASTSAQVGIVDYATVRSPNVDATLALEALRQCDAHGICAWFDSELSPAIGFSNAPGGPALIYGNAFFPWPQAVALEGGDRIDLRLRARQMHGDYLWTWETRIRRGDKRIADFQQSDFFSEPIPLEKLQRHSASHVAELGDEGRVDAAILSLMDGSLALGDIARRVSDRFPTRFPRWEDALARVAELSARYGRAS